MKKTFASDNYSGVHPEIMDALAKANVGHAGSYGEDDVTRQAIARFREIFGPTTEVYFVYNGTGANVLGLKTLTRSFHSIICSELAHINVDESTAPENFTGCKIIAVPTRDGKITTADVEKKIIRLGDQHHPQAKIISISQSTEYATVYTVNEIKALAELAHKNQMYLHMDGARISNASAALGKDFKEFTLDAGVDVLSFGGTKNGLMFGEAVIFAQPETAAYFDFFRKQAMQLHSKMRFISAQFVSFLQNDLWLKNAAHSNKMAAKLGAGLSKLDSVRITQPVEANGVFAIFPKEIIEALQKEYFFYVWNKSTSEVRLMCSFDTTEQEVEGFLTKLKELLERREPIASGT